MTRSPLHTRKVAASRLRIPLEVYEQHLAAGEKWCTACQAWHARDAFGKDKTRSDGLQVMCRDAKAKLPRRTDVCASCRRRQVIYANGWCGGCWMRWDRAGRPAGGPPPPPEPEELKARRQELIKQAQAARAEVAAGRFEDYEFLLSEGEHDREMIARRLGVKPSTVYYYQTRLRQKRPDWVVWRLR